MSRASSTIPTQTLLEGLLLKFKPYNLDVLPLYIVLMAVFPFVLWCMLRKPDLTMLASIALYFAARHFDWNLPSFPTGQLVLQPVLLADPVHVRRLVRARRRLRRPADHPVARADRCRRRLSGVRRDHDASRASFQSFGALFPAVALFDVQPERQDEHGALPRHPLRGHRLLHHPLHAARLEGPGMRRSCSRPSCAGSIRWRCSASASSCRSWATRS